MCRGGGSPGAQALCAVQQGLGSRVPHQEAGVAEGLVVVFHVLLGFRLLWSQNLHSGGVAVRPLHLSLFLFLIS